MTCERCARMQATEGCTQSISFQGYLFSPTYLCMCCGASVGARKWLIDHTCERCDWGNCEAPENWHPKPVGYVQRPLHLNCIVTNRVQTG